MSSRFFLFLVQLTLVLIYSAGVPAVLLGAIVFWFDPRAAAYTAVAVFVWQFFYLLRRTEIVTLDGDDDGDEDDEDDEDDRSGGSGGHRTKVPA